MRKQVTLDEIRSIQLGVLDKVDAFCREKNLRYSLGGGSLLGAIRHKGYIPWDDDIDLMMPRPDYEVFLDQFDGVHENLEIQHYRKDKKCCKPFARISDNRTIMVENLQKCGVNVEIFPIDGLPSGENEQIMFFKRFDEEVSLLVRSTNLYGIKKDALLLLKQFVKKIIDPSREDAVQRFQRFITTYNFETSDYAGAITGAYGIKEIMEKSTFLNYIDVEFEHRQYRAISDYDPYLRKHYGDYMKLPPKEKQVSQHRFLAYWK